MLEAEKPKLTLRDILSLLRQSDENPELLEQFDLGELTKDKVEAYHDVIEMLEADALRLTERAKEFKALADNQIRKAKRVEDRLRQAMRESGSTRLPGHSFSAVLGKRKSLKVLKPEIGVTERQAFPEFVTREFKWNRAPTFSDRECLPDLVDTTYHWDKTSLRDALKAGTAPESIGAFAVYEEQETFGWQIRREV